VSISGPLTASGFQAARQPDGRVPFQYFGIQFRPAIDGAIPSASDLRLLFEIEQPPANPRSLRVEYVLGDVHDRQNRRTLDETVEAKEFSRGRLLRSKTISLAGLADGEYRLAINVRAVDSDRALASVNAPVRIRPQEEPALVALENSKATGTRAIADYIRGLATMAQGSPTAANYLRSALDANPKNAFAAQYLVQVYFRGRQFKPVVDVYNRFGSALFESSAESLAQISMSLWTTGQRDRARELLDRAQRLHPRDPAIATAAAIERATERR
jgi:tetratricopeptide (TPR) repeat protein